jgi:hypothetical protein
MQGQAVRDSLDGATVSCMDTANADICQAHVGYDPRSCFSQHAPQCYLQRAGPGAQAPAASTSCCVVSSGVKTGSAASANAHALEPNEAQTQAATKKCLKELGLHNCGAQRGQDSKMPTG